MAGRRVHVVMDEGLVERIDQALSGESRGEFVRRAVERALEQPLSNVDAPVRPTVESPAPAEQPMKLSDVDAILRRAAEDVVPVRRRHSPTCSCGVCKP